MPVAIATSNGIQAAHLARPPVRFRTRPRPPPHPALLRPRVPPHKLPPPFRAPTSLASGLPPELAPLAAPIDAALKPLKLLTLPLELLIGPSLSANQCAPGFPAWPACAIPGGSVEALTQSIGPHDPGLSPAAAAAVVADVLAHGASGGGGGGGGGVRYEER